MEHIQEYELGLAMINLQLAIKNNNLNNAKQLVDFLNNHYNYIYNHDTLPLAKTQHFIIEYCVNLYIQFEDFNETYFYVINNLNNYLDIQKLQWQSQIDYLFYMTEKTQENIDTTIINFVNSNINNDLTIEQYNDLIRLANKIQDNNLLLTIRNKLLNLLQKGAE